MGALRSLLAEAADGDARSRVLTALLGAQPDVLAALSKDAQCLRAIDLWLLDLLPDVRSFHILELALKVSTRNCRLSFLP